MTRILGVGMAVFAVAALGSCGSSSLESSSAALGDKACGSAFACEGYTPGFWSNKNGCAQLEANGGALLDMLAGYVPDVASCDDVAALVKADASEMGPKLLAMWTAFALNFWNYWDGDCNGGEIAFHWDPEAWLPGGAGSECQADVEAWFSKSVVTFDELTTLGLDLIENGTRCEQETLKNFFDAANNDAAVCVCPCITGGNGGMTGTGAL